MHKPWTPPLRWVFGAALLLGCFSTLQAYRLTSITSKDPTDINVAFLLVLNLVYWFVPASFSPLIFSLVRRLDLQRQRALTIMAHVLTAFAMTCTHAVGLGLVRAGFFGPPPIGWMTSLQRMFLTNLDFILMTYTSVVGFTYALGYYREVQTRSVREAHLETRLVEARLKTLEAELHPHFLFNTLHAISTLLHSKPDAADRMISRLSDLLRLTFDRSGAAKVPLQEELEFLQKYLEIEQIRFQDRLTVQYDIDPLTLDAEVPRLILQPIVENAIKHGVSPRTGPGSVHIAARVDNDRLCLEVKDNGVGLTGKARMQFDRGVGLANTRDRLECLYGDRSRLEFSEVDTGLTVRIAMPLRPASVTESTTRVA